MARRKSGSASPALTPRTPAAVARGCAGAKRAPRPQRLAAVGVPSLRRLARRAGVKRIAPSTYQSTREALNAWLRLIVRDVCCIVENRRRVTATLPDVLYALKRNGRTLYGWSGEGGSGHSVRVQRLTAPADAPTPAAFTRGGTSPDASLLLVQRTLSAYFQRNRADECAVEELQRALAAAAAAKGLPPPPRAQLDVLLQSLSDANRIMLSQDGATVYLL